MALAGCALLGGLAAWGLPGSLDYIHFMRRESTPVMGLPMDWVFAPFGLLLLVLRWGLTRLVIRVRQGQFGSRLLVKLAAIFALVGVVPGVLIYVVSYQFVSRSIESWFDVKVEAALREDPLVRAAFAAFPGAEMIDEATISGPTQKPWSRRA